MKKNKKNLSLILAFVIIGSTFIIAAGNTTQVKSNASNLSVYDKKVASDISYMTGASSQEILKLKNEGKSWNEVLELLKNQKNYNQDDIDKRSNLLATNGLDDAFLEKIKQEGFSNDQITETKMLADRVIFQLNEITNDESNTEKQIKDNEVKDKSKDLEDVSHYSDLAKKIQLNDSIYFMLKLEKDFGSYEKVLDEYLYSLQLDIKLDKYIEDKKAYEKEKNEKSSTVNLDKIITLAKIEEKVLDKLQKMNNVSQQNTSENKNDSTNGIDNSKTNDTSIQVPLPSSNNSTPENPASDIMKEINNINQQSFNP